MFDWLFSFREETKRVIERTNQLKRENERLRKETEALRSITPEKIAEIVKKSSGCGTVSRPFACGEAAL